MKNHMKSLSKFKRVVIQFSLVFLLAIAAWTGLHRPPYVPPDIYPYLNTMSTELVEQCSLETRKSPTIFWEDLLAIRSSLSQRDAQPLIVQLRNKVPFSDLNWGALPSSLLKTVRRHREILSHYRFYHPHTYKFPVAGTTWFEDSFGADREGGLRRHEGTDLFGREGTQIVSICGGEIEELGWNRLGGERVGVRGDDDNYYYYAHLQLISPSLVKGNRIEIGDYIGTMGHTGDAITTPDHLHFGIELPNGQWINPYPFLKVWQYWSNS